MYDSITDTQAHIRRVSILISQFAIELLKRANNHDDSKLIEPEKGYFDRETPKLKALTYGTDEYKESLKALGVALQHHYKENSHHPEHYIDGVNGMDLLDIVEMLLDWKAASERHSDGNIYKSLDINKGRFGLSEQLYTIFKNSIDRVDFLKTEKPV